MVNLIANRTLLSGIHPGAATPAAMADALESLLEDTGARQAQQPAWKKWRAALEGAGPLKSAGVSRRRRPRLHDRAAPAPAGALRRARMSA
jgi:hypothetical protein